MGFWPERFESNLLALDFTSPYAKKYVGPETTKDREWFEEYCKDLAVSATRRMRSHLRQPRNCAHSAFPIYRKVNYFIFPYQPVELK